MDQSPESDEDRKSMEHIPYASGVGSVMYLMLSTRPDLAHGMSVVSRYMANPGHEHWRALKWMLRYLRRAPGIGLLFEKQMTDENPIKGYVDSDFVGNMDSRKSLS
ncbi:secreted RxLR effector protein 161-like [Primulina tabacum]|uniref:secreted RxLR effector protein 161-like n=1 Tax=Primulina tabacum TaxID=48773 RepID=UPI003F5A03C1